MEARQKSERLTTDRKYTEDRWKLERKEQTYIMMIR